MVDAATTNSTNGTAAATNGKARMSTLPREGHNWQITLKDKIIASKLSLSPPISFLRSMADESLVTGANQGIGLGLAEVCLANSATKVYSLDISSPGEDFASLSKANPGKFSFLQVDVTSEESVAAALETIVKECGRFDGMIANAGMTRHQPALDFTMAQVEQLFKLNVYGAWNCATAAARAFIKLGIKGSIVFTSSMTSYRPNRVCSLRQSFS